MNKIAWVTDSTTKFRNKEIQDIVRIPVLVVIDEVTYIEGENLKKDFLSESLKNPKSKITTSQPSIGNVVEQLEKIKEEYDEIVIMTISENLSGTKNCVKQAADIVGIKNTTIETKGIGHMVGTMIEEAQEMFNNGKSIEEIKEIQEKQHEKYRGYAIVGSLERLKSSGRISSFTAAIGGALKITPIIEINDGYIRESGKTRGREKALKEVIARLKTSNIEEVYLMGIDTEEEIKKLKSEFSEFKQYEEELVLPIAVHGGMGTYLIVVKEK